MDMPYNFAWRNAICTFLKAAVARSIPLFAIPSSISRFAAGDPPMSSTKCQLLTGHTNVVWFPADDLPGPQVVLKPPR